MDLTKLSYFTTAAECGSFSETARRLFTSQPNISKQIASMEKELDTRLFIRDRQTLRLTKAGEYLFEQTRSLPAQFERIFETARALGRSDSGGLSIGLLAGLRLDADIMRRFQNFTSRSPLLDLNMEREGFSALRNSLATHRFDVIITLSFDIDPSPDLVVASIKSKQQPAIFVSRLSPLAEKLDDLRGLPFVVISPRESYGGYEQLLTSCRKQGFEPNIVRLADSLDSLLFYVETGAGVAILDRNTRFETDQNIRVIPIDDADMPDMVAVWSKNSTNPHIPGLIECLQIP